MHQNNFYFILNQRTGLHYVLLKLLLIPMCQHLFQETTNYLLFLFYSLARSSSLARRFLPIIV